MGNYIGEVLILHLEQIQSVQNSDGPSWPNKIQVIQFNVPLVNTWTRVDTRLLRLRSELQMKVVQVCNRWCISSAGLLRTAGEDDWHAAEGEVGRPADWSADSGPETRQTNSRWDHLATRQHATVRRSRTHVSLCPAGQVSLSEREYSVNRKRN